MEIDWKMIAVIFAVFQFICWVIAFCVIKFNDFAHLEHNQRTIESKIEKISDKQDSFCIALNKIATDVSFMAGKHSK